MGLATKSYFLYILLYVGSVDAPFYVVVASLFFCHCCGIVRSGIAYSFGVTKRLASGTHFASRVEQYSNEFSLKVSR